MESTFIFPLLFSLIPVVIVGIIIALIVYAVKRKQGIQTEVSFTPRFILKIYVYFMILASIITFVGGASFLFNGFFANQFGQEFSYQPQYVNAPVKAIPVDVNGNPKDIQPQYEIPVHAAETDIIRGITMVLFATLIGLIHVFVARTVEPFKERQASVLYRLYVVLGLSIFTIGSIVSIPVGIYKTLSYNLIEQPANLDPYQRLIPGESLSSAIVYLPFWLYFIWTLYKLHQTKSRK